ncbi:hypothetical protein QFC21_002033 [Naganishia friedmannii]|uniref:Uncharacterized protein n=1 Tax=Naganishia friedmannii TaxID=89922 RepID=A0ACC2W1L6_9TREE|nr:hypothetical protein QFC21_002033 [Naganishia friedmannii]
MTVPLLNSAALYQSLTSASTSSDLLCRLKEVKNALIGNPVRKSEIVTSRQLLGLLTDYVRVKPEDTLDYTRLEVLNEATVILGSISNFADIPTDLKLQVYILSKALPSLLRALRNYLIAIADYLWGWDSRTDLETEIFLDLPFDAAEAVSSDGDIQMKKIEPEGIDGSRTRAEARLALLSVYKKKHINALLSLLIEPRTQNQPQIVLPLLQMLAQTAMYPVQRAALCEWGRTSPSSENALDDAWETSTPSIPPRNTVRFSPLSFGSDVPKIPSPLVQAICNMVLGVGPLGLRANSNFKLKQAGLDLLTVLVRDKTTAIEAMQLIQEYDEGGRKAKLDMIGAQDGEGRQWRIMTELLDSRVPGIGISAAACLVSFFVIAGGDATTRRLLGDRESWHSLALPPSVSGVSLLQHLSQFMDQAQPSDERIKACYLTGRLVEDNLDLQRKATETNIIARCVDIIKLGDRELRSQDSKDRPLTPLQRPQLGIVTARRLVNAGLTAVATLCTYHEAAKQKAITLGILPLLSSSLYSSAYGTRTAACQVARVFSRSIAILRTTLVDSGVAKAVIELLINEEQSYAASAGYQKGGVEKQTLQSPTAALSAATATLCNLICEFSPMQADFIAQNGIQTLVRLTDATDREVRINSIWALRNMVFKSEEGVRRKVIDELGWTTLRRHLQDPHSEIAEQALAFTRNLIAEASEAEITRLFDGVGEEALFDSIEAAMTVPQHGKSGSNDANEEGLFKPCGHIAALQASDRLEQALFVLYNIALGNEFHREAILKRPNILTGMKQALYMPESPLIKIPAIGAFINLVETNDRHRRTRQEVINRLRPYLIPAQVRALCTDVSFDVRDKAGKLLAILEVGMHGVASA